MKKDNKVIDIKSFRSKKNKIKNYTNPRQNILNALYDVIQMTEIKNKIISLEYNSRTDNVYVVLHNGECLEVETEGCSDWEMITLVVDSII